MEIAVRVQDGRVLPPPTRVKATQGRTIRLVVTSDVATVVHVHGYDLEKAIPADRRTAFEWVAERTGFFRIETHDDKLELVQLQVR